MNDDLLDCDFVPKSILQLKYCILNIKIIDIIGGDHATRRQLENRAIELCGFKEEKRKSYLKNIQELTTEIAKKIEKLEDMMEHK